MNGCGKWRWKESREIQKRKTSGIDIDQPVRDADGDKWIEMDLAAEIDKIIDRKLEQDDLDENAKRYSVIQLKNERPHKFRGA